MDVFVGHSGVIVPPAGMGIQVKSIQADVLDASVTNVTVTLSGRLGTEYSFNAITPVFGDFRFYQDSNVTVTSMGGVNRVIINYIKYGDQTSYMTGDPSRVKWIAPGKWDV